jgi:hypothetical protein
VTVGSPVKAVIKGNVTLNAYGSGDTLTINASPASEDKVNLGSNDTLIINHDQDTINARGAGDSIYLNNTALGSVINVDGNATKVFLGSNSSDLVHLNPVATGDVITVQGNVGNTYSGIVDISGFGLGKQIDLQGLDLPSGVAITNYAQVLANLHLGSITDTLNLLGGGEIKFDQPTAFHSSEFLFSTSTGPVGPTATPMHAVG